MKRIAIFILLAACAVSAQAQNPRVWLDTEMGPIIVELDPGAAPITVQNFLRYVNDGFYDGLVIHRVDPGFVIQGGGFNEDIDFVEPTYAPIDNEAGNGLGNVEGTIAMARTSDPDSATSQFFINLADNASDLGPGGFTDAGYAVFGEVVFGMSTIETIEALSTAAVSVSGVGTLFDFPLDTPTIHRAVETDGFPLMPDHSGSWYNPANSGVGFNIEIGNDNSGQGPIANVYWYNFDEQRQFWLVGSAAFDYGATEVTLDLFSNPGDEEGVSFQNPPESSFSNYGTLTLSFENCTSGTASYDLPDYGSGSIPLSRLSLPDDYNCAD